MSAPDVLIPSFSADVVRSLPLLYRATALHMANIGRAIIKEDPEQLDPKEQP